MPQKGAPIPHWQHFAMKAHENQQLQAFLCLPPAHPAKLGLNSSNYFWQDVNRSRQRNQKTVIYEMQDRESASEPGYQISKHKVTLICLGEQLLFCFV